jgi:hypothetical protein
LGYDEVTNFRLLGTVLQSNSSNTIEIAARKKQSWAAIWSLKPLWSNKFIRLADKFSTFNTLVKSILTQNLEIMALNNTEMKALNGFYRRLLRIVLGLKRDAHITIDYVELSETIRLNIINSNMRISFKPKYYT